jgi:hypothetical protein
MSLDDDIANFLNRAAENCAPEFRPFFEGAIEGRAGTVPRPDKFYPDGSPILSDELLSAELKWATLFEDAKARIVGQTKTLYGERLSTVWLGLNHNFFGGGPPLIYETMLFAPDKNSIRRRSVGDLLRAMKGEEVDTSEYDEYKAYIDKNYPNDQLQLRYATREQAAESHRKLKLQCLIPPRWRHAILGRFWGDPTWLHYDEEIDEWWK